jgi:hypothetical protein
LQPVTIDQGQRLTTVFSVVGLWSVVVAKAKTPLLNRRRRMTND